MGFEHPSASEKIPLSVWNKILDMARDYYAGGRTAFKTGGGLLDPGREDETMVLVKNTTNAAVPQFGILQAGAPVVLPAASEPTFKERRVVTGTTPAAGLPFVITQEPIAAGSIGRAIDLGVTPVKLNVLDAAHQYADAAADTTQLQTQKGQGPARIWWKDAGVGGSIWALVLLGPSGDDCGACLSRLCVVKDANGAVTGINYLNASGQLVPVPVCVTQPQPPPANCTPENSACGGGKIPSVLYCQVMNVAGCQAAKDVLEGLTIPLVERLPTDPCILRTWDGCKVFHHVELAQGFFADAVFFIGAAAGPGLNMLQFTGGFAVYEIGPNGPCTSGCGSVLGGYPDAPCDAPYYGWGTHVMASASAPCNPSFEGVSIGATFNPITQPPGTPPMPPGASPCPATPIKATLIIGA